jgi:hypothetical protein
MNKDLMLSNLLDIFSENPHATDKQEDKCVELLLAGLYNPELLQTPFLRMMHLSARSIVNILRIFVHQAMIKNDANLSVRKGWLCITQLINQPMPGYEGVYSMEWVFAGNTETRVTLIEKDWAQSYRDIICDIWSYLLSLCFSETQYYNKRHIGRVYLERYLDNNPIEPIEPIKFYMPFMQVGTVSNCRPIHKICNPLRYNKN